MNESSRTLKVLEVRGSPREMGRQHGEAVRDGAAELFEIRMRLLIGDAAEAGLTCTPEDILRIAGRSLSLHAAYAPAVHAEFLGIAEGAAMTPERLLVANGYTDLKDRLLTDEAQSPKTPGASGMGCTMVGIGPARSATGGVLVGQSWDMHASAQPLVIGIRRRPAEGPESFSVTTTGCLSLVGLNAEGIAAGNNNLAPDEARDGVIYLAMIHNALAQTSLDRAAEAITDCPRMSGHNYYLASAGGRILDIETTARDHHVSEVDSGAYVHANHYLDASLARREMTPPQESTRSRLARMEALLAAHREPIGPETIERFLADREGGEERCMCRLGEGDECRTCAVTILAPASREVFCHVGPAGTAPLERFTVG